MQTSRGIAIAFSIFLCYNYIMKNPKKKIGAPKKPPDKARGELMQFRATLAEKQAFQAAADADGKKISEWIRDRLRAISRAELEKIGLPVPFLPSNLGS
jgi:hypothetical protein